MATPYPGVSQEQLKHIQQWINQEQAKARPAWYDGMHLYTREGKYEPKCVNGKWVKGELVQPLAYAGFIRWFDPEFLHNAECAACWKCEQEEKAARDQEQKNEDTREHAAKLSDDEKRDEAVKQIDAFAESNAVNGSKGTWIDKLDDAGLERITGTRYGDHFGISKSTQRKGYWVITHIPTGGSINVVERKMDAVKIISLIHNSVDWNFTDPGAIPSVLALYCKCVNRYVTANPTLGDAVEIRDTLYELNLIEVEEEEAACA